MPADPSKGKTHNSTVQGNKYNEEMIIAQLKDENLRAVAFSAIVKEHSEDVYRHIRRMVLAHEDADDITQNTFIKAWMNIGSFQGKSKISTWLYRIAINETLTFLNKNRTTLVSLDTPEGAIAQQLESDTLFNGDKAHRRQPDRVGAVRRARGEYANAGVSAKARRAHGGTERAVCFDLGKMP